MNKLLAIFLFFVLLIPSASYLFVFWIPRAQVRQEVKERLKSDISDRELVLLKIPLVEENSSGSSFFRFHDREFRYQGKMYDVVRQEEHSDTTWYYCLYDEKETELYADLDKYAQSEWALNSHKPKRTELIIQPLHWCFQDTAPLSSGVVLKSNQSYSSFLFIIKAWLVPPDYPPPEV